MNYVQLKQLIIWLRRNPTGFWPVLYIYAQRKNLLYQKISTSIQRSNAKAILAACRLIPLPDLDPPYIGDNLHLSDIPCSPLRLNPNAPEFVPLTNVKSLSPLLDSPSLSPTSCITLRKKRSKFNLTLIPLPQTQPLHLLLLSYFERSIYGSLFKVLIYDSVVIE